MVCTYFFITGYDETKPLMQWQDENNRVSWFASGTPEPYATDNVKPLAYNEVVCIIPFRHLFDGVPQTTKFHFAREECDVFKYYHKKHRFEYLLCLAGAKPENCRKGLTLFPCLLKIEFHGVRSTIEV